MFQWIRRRRRGARSRRSSQGTSDESVPPGVRRPVEQYMREELERIIERHQERTAAPSARPTSPTQRSIVVLPTSAVSPRGDGHAVLHSAEGATGDETEQPRLSLRRGSLRAGMAVVLSSSSSRPDESEPASSNDERGGRGGHGVSSTGSSPAFAQGGLANAIIAAITSGRTMPDTPVPLDTSATSRESGAERPSEVGQSEADEEVDVPGEDEGEDELERRLRRLGVDETEDPASDEDPGDDDDDDDDDDDSRFIREMLQLLQARMQPDVVRGSNRLADHFPTFPVERGTVIAGNSTCMICLDELEGAVMLLPCLCVGHEECLRGAIKNDVRCPNHRMDVREHLENPFAIEDTPNQTPSTSGAIIPVDITQPRITRIFSDSELSRDGLQRELSAEINILLGRAPAPEPEVSHAPVETSSIERPVQESSGQQPERSRAGRSEPTPIQRQLSMEIAHALSRVGEDGDSTEGSDLTDENGSVGPDDAREDSSASGADLHRQLSLEIDMLVGGIDSRLGPLSAGTTGGRAGTVSGSPLPSAPPLPSAYPVDAMADTMSSGDAPFSGEALQRQLSAEIHSLLFSVSSRDWQTPRGSPPPPPATTSGQSATHSSDSLQRQVEIQFRQAPGARMAPGTASSAKPPTMPSPSPPSGSKG